MISVKAALLSELELLAPLFEAYRAFYGKSSETRACKDFLKERIKKQESVIFLAYWEQQAVGFVQLYPLFSSTRLQRLWLLNDLYVAAEYRQKKVGTQLIQKAQQHSLQTRAAGLLLETEKNNLPGNRLYPKMGFALDREHNYYFWDTPY